ncbi:MAG: hypothetical protein Q7R98_01455 [Candidatus Jorgensenbacteria bacterium]|nr:hypothetical protein [Candidatus Jorgensenbacteria bacterium]
MEEPLKKFSGTWQSEKTKEVRGFAKSDLQFKVLILGLFNKEFRERRIRIKVSPFNDDDFTLMEVGIESGEEIPEKPEVYFTGEELRKFSLKLKLQNPPREKGIVVGRLPYRDD